MSWGPDGSRLIGSVRAYTALGLGLEVDQEPVPFDRWVGSPSSSSTVSSP